MKKEIDPRDMPPGTKAWIYLCRSPDDNPTLESREAEIRELVQRKGWKVDRVFRDRRAAGKSTGNREEFEMMVYLARQKPRLAGLIIVWDFSSFGRDQAQFYRAQLHLDGWRVLAMRGDIPPAPPGSVFEALSDWKNEQFLIDLRASTRRGLRYIAERGCLPVGPVCTGYISRQVRIGTHRDGTPRMGRKPEPDPKVAPLVVKAFEMKAHGATNPVIAQETGLYGPSPGSWYHFFRNRVYIGEYEFQGQVFEDVYPAIVSRELFEAVQKHLRKRRRRSTGRHHPRRFAVESHAWQEEVTK